MYQQFFGLKDNPFSIAPNPRYLYMSERHREALAHLIYGLNSDGAFILLSGDVGTGKTTVSRCLLEQLNEKTRLALVLNPKVSVLELLATICDELRITYPKENTSVKVFVDYINRYLLGAHAQGYKVVVLIDEAQNLQMDVLEQLRLLTNLETNERKLLQIILLGQPELLDMLAKPELSQLAQRITARYHLKPLNANEVRAYINHRLRVAGASHALFSRQAIKQVADLTQGVPRLINVLCDRSLLGAYVQNKNDVNKKIVKQAANEILPAYQSSEKKSWFGKIHAVYMVILLAALIFILYGLDKNLFIPAAENHQVSLEQNKIKVNKPIKTVSLLTKTKVKKIVKKVEFIRLVWPKEISRLRSNIVSFQILLSAWGLEYKTEKGTPCFYAQSKGLACLHGQGNIETLRDYNRPAILKLYNPKGQPVFALLSRLKNKVAFINIAGKKFVVSLHELQKYWYGDFSLIWKKPPFYKNALRPGDEGEEIVWLAQALNKLNQNNTVIERREYSPALFKKVREFQLKQGLVADGVVGVQTLIHLNHVMAIKAPSLKKKS